MYKRYYDGYDDCISLQEPVPCPLSLCCDEEKKLLGPFAADDLLLMGVFLFLLREDCQDKLMLAVIGIILFAGFGG